MNSFEEQSSDDNDEIDPRYLAPAVVDPAALHSLIDTLTSALHSYVDTAVGIRAEFDASTAEDDPRIEAVEDKIGDINAEFSRVFEAAIGFESGHTTESWDEDDDDDDDLDADENGAVFEMGFIVVPSVGRPVPASLNDAFSVIEAGGERVVAELTSAGFDVREWGTSRSDNDDDSEEAGDV